MSVVYCMDSPVWSGGSVDVSWHLAKQGITTLIGRSMLRISNLSFMNTPYSETKGEVKHYSSSKNEF